MEFLVQELNGKRPLLPPDLPMSPEVSRGDFASWAQTIDAVDRRCHCCLCKPPAGKWQRSRCTSCAAHCSITGGGCGGHVPHAGTAAVRQHGCLHHLYEPHSLGCAGGGAAAEGVRRCVACSCADLLGCRHKGLVAGMLAFGHAHAFCCAYLKSDASWATSHLDGPDCARNALLLLPSKLRIPNL